LIEFKLRTFCCHGRADTYPRSNCSSYCCTLTTAEQASDQGSNRCCNSYFDSITLNRGLRLHGSFAVRSSLLPHINHIKHFNDLSVETPESSVSQLNRVKAKVDLRFSLRVAGTLRFSDMPGDYRAGILGRSENFAGKLISLLIRLRAERGKELDCELEIFWHKNLAATALGSRHAGWSKSDGDYQYSGGEVFLNKHQTLLF
jgi:hypothetical protein